MRDVIACFDANWIICVCLMVRRNKEGVCSLDEICLGLPKRSHARLFCMLLAAWECWGAVRLDAQLPCLRGSFHKFDSLKCSLFLQLVTCFLTVSDDQAYKLPPAQHIMCRSKIV